MRIKWNGQTINVKPTKSSKRYFETTWNDYTIVVELDEWLRRNYKQTKYDAWCYTPHGGLIVDGASYDTIRKAVQDCFDNIGFPLLNIGEEYDANETMDDLIDWYVKEGLVDDYTADK